MPSVDTKPPANHPVPKPAAPDLDAAKAGPAGPPPPPAATHRVVCHRPGDLRSELYDGPVHYRDAQGRSLPIDTTLGASKDGRRHNIANAFDLSLADSAASSAVARVAFDGLSVGFGLDGAAKVTGIADARSMTCAKVRNDTDLRLSSRSSG